MAPLPDNYERGKSDERFNEAIGRLEHVAAILESLPCGKHSAWLAIYRWLFAGVFGLISILGIWLWAHITGGER